VLFDASYDRHVSVRPTETADDVVATPRRGRGGRPAGEAPALALAAAMRLVVERGYTGMSLDAVSAESGVSKTTLYRHWPTKEDLAVAAVRAIPCEFPPPTRNPRQDALTLLHQVAHALTSPYGTMMRRFVDAVVDHPPLGAAWRESVIAPRRRHMGGIIRRAQREGQLRADLDVEFAVDTLLGGIMYRHLVTGADAEGLPEMAVATLWDAWAGPAQG
jgi:AcrR family transcriptional regulator